VDEQQANEQQALPVVLICTVGGSPQPIATALRMLRPDAAWFLVSDGKTGESSRGQVETPEIEYDRATGARGPGLKFAAGCPAQNAVFMVPADDPDGAYKVCRSALAEARKRFPGHRLVADYTGGTKSMTGALLMAAFAQPGVEVQFMAGKRPDLVQVQAGSETPQVMAADFVLAERDFAAAEQAVDGYDYAAANAMLNALRNRLENIGTRPPKAWRSRLNQALAWTGAMAQWDAFDHRNAARRVRGDAALKDMLTATGHLQPLLALAEAGKDRPGWDICADLWCNALRRGERGRHDDAVARLYRLLEAVAQAHLWTRHGLETRRIAPEELPDKMQRSSFIMKTDPETGAAYAQLALNQTVELLRCRDPGDRFVAIYTSDRTQGDRLHGPRWLTGRNRSILAHGFRSIDAETWDEARSWVEAHLTPFFASAAFLQLPRQIPDPQNALFDIVK
jgi:CRISPR-associated protein (TIGR02710 family)